MKRLLLVTLLALLVGGLVGWRAHITFGAPIIHNIPIPVRSTLA